MNPKKSILKQQLSILFAMFFFFTNAQNPFIENKGQLPKNVISKTNLPSGSLFIEKGKLTYAFYNGKQLANIHDGLATSIVIDAHAYSVSFLNSNTGDSIILEEESEFFENYYLGDKSNWATEVKSYKKQLHKEIYEHIDISYYVQKDQLKYEFIVAKHGNPQSIKMQYKGMSKFSLNNGNLLVKTSVNTITEHKPYAYQMINDVEVEVVCNYNLHNKIITFNFPEAYNKNFPLIIDPILKFSTYSGSTANNFGYTATYDNLGFLYSGGTVFGVGYPTTLGAYQLNYANSLGGTDIGITKYDTSGTTRIYSTYLGGTKDELPHSMIVNSANELFIFGTTGSADFPVTNSAYQTTFNGGPALTLNLGVSFPDGSDIFVSRLSANGGSLLASTFLGGTDNDGLNTASQLRYNYADEVRGEIDIDKQNNIYIATCTKSTDFPTTNSFQSLNSGGQEGCIVKMDNQLTSVIWSSYLGGATADAIYSLALDKNDNIYVTGGTTSTDFPITATAYQTLHQDSVKADAFISLINSEGTQILSSSYYGTEQYDQSYFVEIGSDAAVYLFGQTKASATDLVQNATYFQSGAGQFIAVFTEDLDSVLRATVLGTGKGTPDISPTAFLVDVCDKIYLSGWGSNVNGGPLSTLNLLVSGNAYQLNTDGNDFYLIVVDDALSSLVYATYFGGSQSGEHVDGGTSRFDKKGIIYQSVCAGCQGNSDFPIEPNPGAVSSINNSSFCNNGVFKFNFDFPMVIADFNAPWVGCDTSLSFQNLSSSNTPVIYQWDFGDGTSSAQEHPNHNYTQAGNYTVTLIASSPGACNISDTTSKQIYILRNGKDTLTPLVKCKEEQLQIGLLPVNDPTITYFWFPSTNLSSANVSNPFCSSPTTVTYQLFISNGTCTDSLLQEIVVVDFLLDAGTDTSYCNEPITLQASYSGASGIHWASNVNFTDTLSLTDNLTVASIALFYVKVTDGNCEQIDSVEVKMESININLIGDLELCEGDSVFLTVNNLNPTIPILSYSWLPSDVIYAVDSSSIYDFRDTSGWYSVEVINTDECIMKDSVFVNIYEYPILDSLWLDEDTVFRGETTYLNIQTANSFNWKDVSSTANRVEITPAQKICYAVEVYNIHNCMITDSICIEVLDVFCNEDSIVVPTAFSPNEDEVNEGYFIIDVAGVIIDFKLEIFNRLGQKVFSTIDKFEKWDGTYLGIKLNPQVFDFYLELKCIGDKQLFRKGNITLIR